MSVIFINPYRFGAAAATDPYFANVSLLLHGDGTNGSTTIIDSSPSTKTVTAFGNAQISTAQSKFGGASIAFDGTGDYLTVPTSTAFDWSDNTTIEAWIYLNTYQSGTSHMFGTSSSQSDFKTGCYVTSVGAIAISKIGISDVSSSSGVIALSTWYHVAFVKSSTTAYIFVNGTQVGSGTASNAWSTGSAPFSIGRTYQHTGGDKNWNGYIDELRITKGVARYTANFTPPGAPFPDI